MGTMDGDEENFSLIKRICGGTTMFEFVTNEKNDTLLSNATSLFINETVVVTVDDDQQLCNILFLLFID